MKKFIISRLIFYTFSFYIFASLHPCFEKMRDVDCENADNVITCGYVLGFTFLYFMHDLVDIVFDVLRKYRKKDIVENSSEKNDTEIDAVLVKHGEWFGTICSACGESTSFYYDCNYCPNCGAKMDAINYRNIPVKIHNEKAP